MASSEASGGASALVVLDSTAGNLQTGRSMGEHEVGADHVHFTWLDAEQDVKLVLIDDYAHDRALLAVEGFPEGTLDAALD
ncbi:hypothetical protein [Deinococcus enclensis]|uniref:Uncharacterized protein n=1 Tax=Deinococcus enclensis TaxID=1049582 RepID=A0ABT9MG02_9DEIO|nr:hypothetical protein [Deinococcus enclensis]MDP9765532.1 hypothetical protein [Deinococcus enclensis]